MKIFFIAIIVASSFVVACNDGEKKDSTELAEDKNEQRADSADMGEKMEDDHEFMVEAASGGLMEVELGKFAAQNAASPKVKQFGQRMVTDHSKANEELKSLASQKNITLPSAPGDKHQSHINDLQQKKGADFDKAYMSMMVEDHEEDVKKFEEAANDAKDTEIKAFAAKTLPVLKEHHQQAKSIKDGLK